MLGTIVGSVQWVRGLTPDRGSLAFHGTGR